MTDYYAEIERLIIELTSSGAYKKLPEIKKPITHKELFNLFLKQGEEEEQKVLDSYIQEAQERDEVKKTNQAHEIQIVKLAHLLISSIFPLGSKESNYIRRLIPKSEKRTHKSSLVRRINTYKEYKAQEIEKIEASKARKERLARNRKIKHNCAKVGADIRITKASELIYDSIVLDAKILIESLGLSIQEDHEIFNELNRRGYVYRNGEFVIK